VPYAPATQHQQPWQYLFESPALDVETDPRVGIPGTFSRLDGVDGRYPRRIRRFPGFKLAHALPNTVAGSAWGLNGLTGLKFFKSFAITQGPDSDRIIRGYLVLGNQGPGTLRDKLFAFFSVNGGALESSVVVDFGTVGSDAYEVQFIDVAVDHQMLIVVGEARLDSGSGVPMRVEKLARYAGSAGGWQTIDWVPTAENADAIAPTFQRDDNATVVWGAPSYIQANKRYGLAVRVVFPDQGYVSAISGPVEHSAALANYSGTGYLHQLMSNLIGPTKGIKDTDAAVFTRAVIQCFRTVVNDYDTTESRGLLVLESEWEVPRRTTTGGNALFGNATVLTTTTLTDSLGAASKVTHVAVGDTVYLTYHTASPNCEFMDGLTFRRTVTAKDGATGVLTWDEAILDPLLGSGSIVVQVEWNVSRKGNEAETNGSFIVDKARMRWGFERAGFNTLATARFTYDIPAGLQDDSLALLPSLDAKEFSVFQRGNPRTSLAVVYEDLLLRVTTASAKEGSAEIDVVRWDFVEIPRRGVLPVLNRRRIADLNDRVVTLLNAGTFGVAIMQNAVLRIHRSGSRLAIDVIHNEHGALGRYAAVSVGSIVYAASPLGILAIDLLNGAIDLLNATQHVFDETDNWRSDLASVYAAYDSSLGAVMFLNPVKNEMLLLWVNQGVWSRLIDVPFSVMAQATNIQLGGVKRVALLLETSLSVYEADALRAGSSRTTAAQLASGAQTFNGTILSSLEGNCRIVYAGVVDSSISGHFVRIYDVSAMVWRGPYRILSTGSGGGNVTLTFSFSTWAGQGFADGPQAGVDRFTVAAIPLRLTAWPLSVDPSQPNAPVLDLFQLRKVTAMGAAIGEMAGDDGSGNVNRKLYYQLWGRDRTAAKVTAEAGMSETTNDDTFALIEEQDAILRPGVECWSSNLDVDLLALLVHGTIERSRTST